MAISGEFVGVVAELLENDTEKQIKLENLVLFSKKGDDYQEKARAVMTGLNVKNFTEIV